MSKNIGDKGGDIQERSNKEEPLFIADMENDNDVAESEASTVFSESKRLINRSSVQHSPPLSLLPQERATVECSCASRSDGKVLRESEDIRGQIRTPELQKSTAPILQHTVGSTTPSGGRVFTSPLIEPTKHHHDTMNAASFSAFSPTYPPPFKKYPVTSHSTAVDEPLLSQRHLNGTRGTSGRNLPKHIPVGKSPYHVHCVPARKNNRPTTNKINTRKAATATTKAATRPHSRGTDTRASVNPSTMAAASAVNRRPVPCFVAGKSEKIGGGASMADISSDSCGVCGSTIKPASLPSAGTSKKSENYYHGHQWTKYAIPSPAATQPHDHHCRTCGYHGRSCDRERSMQQSLQESQLESHRQLQRIKDNIANCKISDPPLSIDSRVDSKPTLDIHESSLTPPPGRIHQRPDCLKTVYQDPFDMTGEHLSISPLSMSSCSVASNILEKARQRRDHFWTRQPSH